MCSGRVIGEVFKERSLKLLIVFFHADYLQNRSDIPMEEGKRPYKLIKVSTIPQTCDKLMVKVFVFEHPKNFARGKQILIEDIFGLDEV